MSLAWELPLSEGPVQLGRRFLLIYGQNLTRMHNVIGDIQLKRFRGRESRRRGAVGLSAGLVAALLLSLPVTVTAAETSPLTPPATPETAAVGADAAAARETEIARLLRMIFDERSELAAMRREHQLRLETLGNAEFALERSIAAWEADLAATRAEWQKAREQTTALSAELATRQALAARWLAQMRHYPETLREHVAAGIDFDRGGRGQIAADLAGQLAAKEIAPADAWQRIARAQETEEGLARTLELAAVRVAADREADGLRVGLAMLTAPTADGGALALGPGETAPTASPAPTTAGAGLTEALEILQRRRSPAFSDLYVPAIAGPAAATTRLPAVHGAPQPAAATPIEALEPAPLPAAVAAANLPVEPPAAAATGADPVARLDALLSQARAAKAAYAQAAAAEHAAHFARVGALENIEAERGRRLRRLQAGLAEERELQAATQDRLLLENERHTVFRQALLATRDLLLERLDGSLEAAAQVAIGERLATLRRLGQGPAAAAEATETAASGYGAQAAADAEMAALLDNELAIFERLLAAARSAAVFEMPVKLDDGRILQARCLQPSLLTGYFADPATREAGVLVADSRQGGVWRGQVKGLSAAQRQALGARLIDGARAGLLPFDVSGGAAAIQATQEGSLIDWFEAGGTVMWPLLLVAVAGLALVLERAAALLRLQGRTRDLLSRVEAALRQGDYDGAQRLCDPTQGPVQRVLHAALSHRRDSRAAIEDAIQVTALGELPQLQKGLGMLALLAGLAPLLGLLGTVTGMIHTFQMVNLFGSSDTRFLAGGISEALITTEFGLVIAIPLVFAHGILGRLSERILSAIELGAAIVMQQLGHLPTAATTETGAQPSVAAGARADSADLVAAVSNAQPGGGS